MDTKWQAIILIIVILFSLAIVEIDSNSYSAETPKRGGVSNGIINSLSSKTSPSLSFKSASLVNANSLISKVPTRRWGVLDPKVNSESVLIHSLDDNIPLFYYNIHDPHPMASITKLLTAVAVLEDVGLDKKIPITADAVKTEGLSGGLRSGEVYLSKDLLKIMLLESSNDAAAAFEEYFGGTPEFVKTLNDKMEKIGMEATVVEDGSGLSDFNFSTASDILKLSKYIIKKHPQILNWTRSESFLVQPINDIRSQTIYNINPLVKNRNFLGGKTGTSQAAGENLMSIITLNNKKLVIIILGATDRVKEVENLLNWVQRAYIF